jgi:hypothetical protein
MAKGETVGSLRAYFLLVGVLGVASNGFAVLRLRLGLGTVFALAGIAVACTLLFLGLRLKSLIVSSPRFCQQLVIGTGVVVALTAVANLLLGNSLGVAQNAFSLLIVWYLIANLRRLARHDPETAEAPQLTLVSGKADVQLSRVVGWTVIGVAGAGVLGTLALIGPAAIGMLGSDADPIEYVASAFLVMLPLVLCAIIAYVGWRFLKSAVAVDASSVPAPVAESAIPHSGHPHSEDCAREADSVR